MYAISECVRKHCVKHYLSVSWFLFDTRISVSMHFIVVFNISLATNVAGRNIGWVGVSAIGSEYSVNGNHTYEIGQYILDVHFKSYENVVEIIRDITATNKAF